jgi:DNA-binding NarL/FixJ family response regulator
MFKNETSYGINRLKSKNAQNAIIQKLATDFNLTPIIAEAFYQQFTQYFDEHAKIKLSSGEIAYEAVSANEPAGKHLRIARKITVRLKLIELNTDLDALANYGLAGLRRHRMARITRQAYDQGALLSYEDLALILTTSPATVRRDVQLLRREGMFIMTRGTKQDMGPGLSHKTIILDLYFNGYTFSEIEQKTNHSESSVKRYMAIPVEERPKKYQSIAQTRLKPVVFSYITDSDIAHISHGFDSKSLRKKRLFRWVHEAFDQGALLTQLDLSMLLGVCDAVISQYVNEIQKEGKLLPTRGNIHDMSGAITHKREIITLYLEGYFTPEIAFKTNHSNESVDRYIRDYQRVQLLWQHGVTSIDQISQLSRLSKKVVQQYIDLLPDKVRNQISKIKKSEILESDDKNPLFNKEIC